MIRSAYDIVTRCRACGGNELTPVLDLGQTPLANALLDEADLDRVEPTYPLELAFCPFCTLVQITCTVPPEVLFSDYPYFSSFSDTMCAHAEALVEHVIDSRQPRLAVEVASNDGYLLRHYKKRGVDVLGIEPAANIAQVAREQHGIETLCEFFTADLADKLHGEGIAADVVHAHNVLAHVADLNGFVRGIATLLKSDGVAVIEAPYVRDMIERNEFDTIYHEHLCYFSLTALDRLFKSHGLTILDAQRVAIHGGSLRIMAGRGGRSSRVEAQLDEERRIGMDQADYYRRFAGEVTRLRDELKTTLASIKADGQRIAVYGASAKGSTLLNYCRINGFWGQEIRRAVTLVLNQRIFHEWGVPLDAPIVEAMRFDRIPPVYQFHAAELLRRFEEVMQVWPGYPEPGIHSARALLLALLDRLPEAMNALHIELHRFPTFEPAKQLLANLEAATQQREAG